MKFLSDILARAGLVVDGTVTLNSVANATTDTDRFIVVDSGVVKYRTGTQLLSDIGGISGNQTITLSGDATGSGTTAIAVTLANSGVVAGTYGSASAVPVITVDAKGRVTGVTTASISGSLTFTGDVTGTGTTGSSTTLTLANSGVTAGTYNNVTVNAKGLVTSGSNVSYLTSYTETDTLASVTGRGASTSTVVTFSGGDTNNSSVKLAGYNQRGGAGFHGFLEATNTFASATNPNKYFRLDSVGSLQIINSAYTVAILTLTNAGDLSVPGSVTAGSFIRSGGTSSQFLKADGSVDSSTYATQTFVNTQISNLVNSAPAALDTLNELAAALGNDANFSTTVSTALGNRLRIDINNQGLTSTQRSNGRTNLGVVIGTDVQAWDADLDAIAALAGTSGFLRKTAANTWTLDTNTYLTSYTETDTLATVTGRGATTTAQITVDSVITNNNGNGTNLRIGDDAWIGDINLANTFRVQGVQNAANAYIVFGNGDSTALGRAGTGALTYGGNTVYHAGNLTNLNQLTNGPGYITGNQTITLSGDATGSGTTAITVTLANSGVTAGTYQVVTVDAKGRVTGGSNPTTISGYGITDFFSQTLGAAYVVGANTAISGTDTLEVMLEKLQGQVNARLTGNQTITLSGDATGSGATAITVTLANSGVTAGTYTKVTVDAKGRVTSGTTLSAGDIPTLSYVAKSGDSMTGNLSFGSSGAGLTWAANTDGASITFESTGDGASGGRALSNLLIALTDNGDEGLKVTSASAELLYVNTNQFQYKGNTVWHSANDGSGSGLDADLLDGINSGSFLRSDVVGATVTGTILSTNNANVDGPNFDVNTTNKTVNEYAYRVSRSGSAVGGILIDGRGAFASGTTVNGSTVWHQGNLTNLNQLTNGPGYITSSALSSYLPLSGGTLTGALSGTSATFSAQVLVNLTNGYAFALNRPATTNYIGISYRTNGSFFWFVGMRENSTNDYIIYSEQTSTDYLRINSGTGAATFNSSVTAGSFVRSGGTSSQFLKADGSVDSNTYITGASVGNGTLTLAVSGTGLSGSASFTANQSGNTTFTVTSNATSANTASAIVARDASGNFSAGAITSTALYGTNYTTLTSGAGTGTAVYDTITTSGNRLYRVIISGNPNSAGSGSYLDWIYGKLIVGTGWNGSSVVNYIEFVQESPMPRTLFGSGGGDLTVDAVFFQSNTESDSVGVGSTYTVRFKISGYNSSGTGASTTINLLQIG